MILKGTGGLRVPRVPGKKGTFHPTMLPNSSRSKQSRKFFFSSYINKKYIIYTKVFCPNFILKSTHKNPIQPPTPPSSTLFPVNTHSMSCSMKQTHFLPFSLFISHVITIFYVFFVCKAIKLSYIFFSSGLNFLLDDDYDKKDEIRLL